MRFTLAPLHGPGDEVIGLVITLDAPATPGAGADRDDPGADTIIGQSAKMQAVFDLIPLMARTEASVLITGETGTGKDKVAEAIHQRSGRADRPFIKINCGALPEPLLESELFGYVKGAFTGAVKDKPGMFRLAQGGTLFLTEIGDMPLPLQVKLLSVLDDQEFFPLGGEKKVQVDVRIIAATHRPLKERVAAGLFREDLFYRLNVLHLHLPPLRERESDTRFLVNHFLRTFAGRTGTEARTFSHAALERIMAYPFPGNIRELRNVVEYCVNICPEGEIGVEHLPPPLLARAAEPVAAEAMVAAGTVPVPAPVAGGDWLAIERQLIVDTLTRTRGNRSQAATILGWGRTTLWRKLKQHGLTPETGTRGGRS
jgi:DNA-binding NtrC family response regulator